VGATRCWPKDRREGGQRCDVELCLFGSNQRGTRKIPSNAPLAINVLEMHSNVNGEKRGAKGC
jgi:hypothetical protein